MAHDNSRKDHPALLRALDAMTYHRLMLRFTQKTSYYYP
jgi:hypothetical protein